MKSSILNILILVSLCAAINTKSKHKQASPSFLSQEKISSAFINAKVVNGQFIGDIFVGSPPKKFKVALDTGSGNLVLPSIECQDETCQLHTQYNRNQSQTSAAIANPFDREDRTQKYQSIEYGTGTLLGKYASDTICFGGEERVCLEDFWFIEAVVMSNDPFADLAFDGILGLGRLDLSLSEKFNFLHSLLPMGLIYFNFNAKTQYLEFVSELQEDQHRLVVKSGYQGYWTIDVQDIIIDGLSQLDKSVQKSKKIVGILDSGSTFITVPQQAYNEIIYYKFSEEDYCFDYESVFPLLIVESGGQFFEVDPYFYILQEREMVISSSGIEGDEELETISHLLGCTLLMKVAEEADSLVLGAPFLQANELWFASAH